LVSEHPLLVPVIHSVKWRVKDIDHLRHKLVRKTLESRTLGARRPEPITADNLFERIEDLAGVRILHLHTKRMVQIHKALLQVFADQEYVVQGPVANTWDDEYRDYFRGIGLKTQSRPSMYTSVHYMIRQNQKSAIRCELQVRTLVEEVWGEVSHTIDYPDPTESVACKEQLKVLARISSGCIRLVDSIFDSAREHSDFKKRLASRSQRKHR